MPVWFSDALGSAAAVLDDALDQDRQRGASGDNAVPVVDSDAFRREVLSTIGEGWRLLLLVGLSQDAEGTRLLAALADDARGEIGSSRLTSPAGIRH